jgi:DNA-binding response OmpR family regulator
MSDGTSSGAVRIRALEFDPQTGTLTVADRKTLLDPRSSNVLSALTESFGECVSKDALLQAAWPAQLVHENSLAKAISRLRRGIEGSGIEIAAVYGLGYRLQNADEWGGEAAWAGGDVPPQMPKRWWRERSTGVKAAVSLIPLAVETGLFIVERPGDSVPVRQTLPITNDAPDAIATILWVDDHPSNNALEVEALRKRRIAVHLAESTEDAFKLLAFNRYALVVSDLGRGEDRLAGLRMIGAMKQRGVNVPVLIYTVRPKNPDGLETLRRLAADSGAVGVAVTPQEVRSDIYRKMTT